MTADNGDHAPLHDATDSPDPTTDCDIEHDEGGSGCCARGYCGPERQALVLARQEDRS